MKKQNRIFHKFTVSENGRPLFIDLNDMAGLMEYDSNGYTNYSVSSTSSNPPMRAPSTVIFMKNGTQHHIYEHITEVLALLEGRNSSTARLLYGK